MQKMLDDCGIHCYNNKKDQKNARILGSEREKILFLFKNIAKDASPPRRRERQIKMSQLDGKTLVVLGDSLIHGNKLGPDATWVALLAKKHGMTAYNYGVNGNPVAYPPAEEEYTRLPMCVRYAEMADDADYVVILGGANDKRLHIPLGEESRRADRSYRDTATFCGALNELIAGVTAKYPKAKILLMTNYNRWPSKNKQGLSDIDYVDAMLQVAAAWSLPCFDNYRESGISFQNPAQLQWMDEGLELGIGENHHFSHEGYEWLTNKYEHLLEAL